MNDLIVRDIPKEKRNEGLEQNPYYAKRCYVPHSSGDRDRALLIYSYWHDGEKWWNVAGVEALTEKLYRADYRESDLVMPQVTHDHR